MSTTGSLRRCLNQILSAVIISCILTIAGTTVSVYVLTERVSRMEFYIESKNVCLGQSICRPEFDSHTRAVDKEFSTIERKIGKLEDKHYRSN